MAAGSVGMSSTGQEIAQPRPLSVLRAEIDRIDNELVRLLNERARVVVEVGARKKAEGGPIYAPIRERAVLQKVLALNSGPLLNASLESIWREIMRCDTEGSGFLGNSTLLSEASDLSSQPGSSAPINI